MIFFLSQLYTEHIERLLLQAHKRLEAFEQSWTAKQQQLEKAVDGPDSTKKPAPELEKVTILNQIIFCVNYYNNIYIYAYISVYRCISTYRYMSVCWCESVLSINLNVFCCISMYINLSQYISMYTNVYRCISEYWCRLISFV